MAQKDVVEQKVVCYTETQARNPHYMDEMFNAGWRVKEISGSSHGTENMCWVLFERNKSDKYLNS